MNPRAEYAANELRQALEHYYTLINHLANATDYLKTLAGEHAATTTIQNTIRNLDPIRSTINATQHHIQTKYNHTHTEEKQPQ